MVSTETPTLTPDLTFASPADEATLQRTAEALRARGHDVHIARDLQSAKEIVLGLVPHGAEVGGGASRTLEELGVTAEIEQSGHYDALRPRMWAMDRQTQGREIRKLAAAPDVALSSAQAVTQDGVIVVASFSGMQLGPIVSGAGKVILPIGAQKIVPDLPTALRRIETYSYPLEDARARVAYGMSSAVNKVAIIHGDLVPGRFSVVLIATAIGF